MADRTIKSLTGATPQPGSGILHPFPTRELPHIDPFVFLDTGAPQNLGTHDIYVGPHSHRGVQPVSLLFRGCIEHSDSLGNHRTVTSGGMQWLISGSGALHEEVLNGDDEGVFHMAQLWINVPGKLKMEPPEHHAVTAEHVPELTSLGQNSVVRLYAGDLDGETGPAPMPTPVLVAHVTIAPGGSVTIPVPDGWTTAFTIVAGTMSSGGHQMVEGDTPVFNDDGPTITVTSDSGGQLLWLCGEPIGEPIAMGGGFVMNTPEEIEAAFDDDRSGRMGTLTPTR
jgi:redox-sensitive bicupin YhaK (pirin superfamily)